MKRLFKNSLALLLAFLMIIPALTFSASAAGQVYAIDGTNYVFLGAGETVTADIDGDGNSETYNTYTTLKDAIAALANGGGVIGIVGEFRDPTTNGDKTFSDISGRDAITIRGIGDGAVLKFDHTLDFKAPVTMENFTLHCRKSDESGNNTKYVFGGGNTTFGKGMKKLGGIYYGNTNGTSAESVVTTFDASTFNVGQIILSGGYTAIGSSSKHGNYEFIFNDYNCNTNIYLGLNNAKNTVYGNINCYINGGTYSTKNIQLHAAAVSGSTVTGAVSVIFNNGMADGFTVASDIDFVIKSGANGTASIKTPATEGGVPTFMFTPNEGYAPAIDGVVLLANAEGEYLLTPTASDATQTFEVTYITTSGDEATAAFYSVDGVKTGFVKNGGGAAEYNGLSVVAFDTIQSALTANTNKADVTLIIIGESAREGLSYPNKYPTNLLTIKGADENAVLKLGANAHPWGNVKIENIALDISGAFCPDGNKIIIGEGVTGTMPKPLWGGGANSPHGGNIEIHSGTWEQVTVGSTAATSETSTKTQSHVLAIYGGDFTNAKIDMGSSVSTTVPKNMILTVNGGTFAENQQIYATNVTSVGGVAAAILNNGIADNVTFTLPTQIKYVIKSGKNGAVSFDGTQFVITPNNGYAAVVDGKLSTSNTIAVDDTTEHTVTYIKATGTAKTYTVDGIKTAYVKKDSGLFKLDDDGTAYYAYSDMKEAVAAAVGGRVLVIGEYTGNLGSYWGGSGVTEISGYDEDAVLTLSALYMWTPLEFKNIKISGNSATLNADSRPIIFGEGIEVVGNGLNVYGSTGAAARPTDVTIKSGKYAKVVGGNVGSTQGLSITLNIEGGDFTEASVNLGNESANTLNGNALLTISGGTFADGQEIKYSKLTTNGGAVAVITNDIDKTYNLTFASTFDAVVRLRDGGTYEISSFGSASEKPTFIFTPENPLYAPFVNGEMITANASGKYYYTPEASDTTSDIEVTWALDTTPKAYLIDGVLTAFASSESTVTIGDSEYYTFDTLTKAVAALGGEEGKVILASNLSNTGGDSGAFVDTANRKPVTIEGLTGSEVLTLDGTFGFKGDVTLDKFTLKFTTTKYINGFGNTTFGKDLKIESSNYFAPVTSAGTFADDITVKALGGTITIYNGIGAYRAIGEEGSVTSIIDGATVNTLNIGYAEKHSTSAMLGAVNLIINSDTVTSKKVILQANKNEGVNLSDGVFTLVFNNGISYTVEDGAKAILDYLVYSGVGGEVYIHENGTKTKAPTFRLVPDEGYSPIIGGVFATETSDGYLYTPEFTGALSTINVEWMSAEDMAPTVYDIDGERYAFVRSGGGVIYFGDEARFAYADINSAVAGLGTNGGNIKVYGNVMYVDGGTLDTNLFADVAGRSKVTVTGIDGTSPCITYYKNADLAGDLEIDNITMHRLAGSLYDTGFITKGYELVLGAGLVTTTDFSQNMTIHGVSGTNETFTKPQVITIKGGNITRVLPGTTWSASTVNGDSIINIEGGTVSAVFGGSHGGQNFNSIINGDVEINISGGNIGTVYSGGNSKSVQNGNVTVNVTGGTFSTSTLRHGTSTIDANNVFTGNSAYVISGGTFIDAKFGDADSRGVTGEEIFIIDSSIEGYSLTLSDKGTVIYYDNDGTVTPAFDDDGTFLGYRILCDIEGVDIVIDGEKVEKTDDNIYTIARGEHNVLFSTLWDIEFNLNGAEGTVPETIHKYNDSVITLTAPDASMKNHYFNGWSVDKDAEKGSLEYTVPNEASVLYAVWTEIKPEMTEDSNIENSDAERVEITSVSEDKYDTHTSVVAAKSAAQNDPAVSGEVSVVYAFSLRAFDENNSAVADFTNGLNVRIPKYVLPERAVGEFYRIYHTETTADVTLASEADDVIAYTEDEDNLYFTAYTAGDYTVVLAEAVYGDYIYKGEYDNISGKYTLVLTFAGAEANYGSFGLKYDTSKLTLDSFTFSDDVTDKGSINVADGGFGTYYNANGIYQNTWAASNGVSIEAQDTAVTIGTFVFTASEGFVANGSTFASADFALTGIELDAGTLETVYSDGYYLYAPCVPSADVYCQPINVSFDIGSVKYAVNVSYTLTRDYGNSFCNNDATGYNNAASIVITNAEGTVYSTSEDKLTQVSDENGKAVLELTAYLADGTYTITFAKNGYVKTSTEFTVSGDVCEIGNIAPLGGDIKADFADSYGDGVVDIDDFIRVLRGFDNNATAQLSEVVDLDENGVVNVSDLAIIKTSMASE